MFKRNSFHELYITVFHSYTLYIYEEWRWWFVSWPVLFGHESPFSPFHHHSFGHICIYYFGKYVCLMPGILHNGAYIWSLPMIMLTREIPLQLTEVSIDADILIKFRIFLIAFHFIRKRSLFFRFVLRTYSIEFQSNILIMRLCTYRSWTDKCKFRFIF